MKEKNEFGVLSRNEIFIFWCMWSFVFMKFRRGSWVVDEDKRIVGGSGWGCVVDKDFRRMWRKKSVEESGEENVRIIIYKGDK